MPVDEQSEERSSPGAPGQDSRELLEFGDIVRFARRNWLLIAGSALVFGLATIVLVSVLPAQYEAAATLVVMPPQFSSDLKPKPLSIQGYQRLLESDGVVTQTFRRLMTEGVLDEEASLRVGGELESRIFVSRRAEETALAPVIEAVARSETPEAAAAVANTWATVFLERSRELTAGSVQPTIEFIDDQYQEVRNELETLSQQRIETGDDFQQRINQAANRWDRTLEEAANRWNRKLVDFQKETEDRIADYQSASRRQIEALAADNGLLRRQGPGGSTDASDPSAASGDSETHSLPGPVPEQLLQLVSLRVQLAQTPQFLVLEKAISEDALWQIMALGQSELLELQPLPAENLLTQEVNPVFSELTLRLTEVEIHPDLVTDKARAWDRELFASLEQAQRNRSAGLSKLVADRATELDALKEQKRLELEELRRARQQELDSLARHRDVRLEELDRDLQSSGKLFLELAANFNEAELARAVEDMEDVRLGSPAVASLQPLPRHLPLKGLGALLLGALFGTVVGLGREVD